MKNLYFFLFSFLSVMAFGQTTDLLISKYGEGSSSNKFLEIYNGTGVAVDLSLYSVSSCSNGCNTPDQFDFPDNITFAPGTMLADGDVYVIADMDADPTIIAATDQTFEFLSNGDDAYALTLAGATASVYTIIDILGDLQGDPGSGWDVAGVTNGTQNHTLTRKSSVCSPNATPLGSFGTDASNSEWVVGANDSGWGTLGAFSGCSTVPAITITSPANMAVIPWGTTMIDVTFTTENAPGGSTVDIIVTKNGGGPVTNPNETSPFTITGVADGDTYVVEAQLLDSGLLDSDTVNFSVENTPPSLPITEAFNYTVSESLGDQDGWNNENSGDDILVGTGSLSYSGLEASTGNHVMFDGSGTDPVYEFLPETTGEVYSSFIFRVTDQTLITDLTDGGYFAILGDFDARLWVRPNPNAGASTFDIGAGASSSSPPNTAPTTYNVGDDIFVVLSYNIDTDTVNAWVNPSSGEIMSSTPPTPTLTELDPTDVTEINQFRIRQDSTGETPFILFDELRIGTSWDDVTPDALSLEDFTSSQFKLYPNPNDSGTLFISSNQTGSLDVKVYDVLGKQVLQQETDINTIDISSLNAGLYMVNISSGNASITKKLVIK